jgi:hypothetical protein
LTPFFANWAIAAVGISSSDQQIPFEVTGMRVGTAEAVYVWQIYARRGRLVSLVGTIDGLVVQERESAAVFGQTLIYYPEAPTDRLFWDCGGFPRRIASTFRVNLSGSAEAVLTDVEVLMIVTAI